MISTLTKFGFALLLLGMAGRADAGFVSADARDDQPNWLVLLSQAHAERDTQHATSSSAENATPGERPTPIEQLLESIEPLGDGAAAGGMSGPGPTSGGVSAACLINASLEVPADDAGALLYLAETQLRPRRMPLTLLDPPRPFASA